MLSWFCRQDPALVQQWLPGENPQSTWCFESQGVSPSCNTPNKTPPADFGGNHTEMHRSFFYMQCKCMQTLDQTTFFILFPPQLYILSPLRLMQMDLKEPLATVLC